MYTSRQVVFPEKYKDHFLIHLPDNIFDFNGEIATFGTKVVLTSYEPKNIAVIIRDAGIAHTMRQLFSLAWEAAQKYKRKL